VFAEPAAADLKEACAASYEQAQMLRRAGKLTLARAQVLVCLETCPEGLSGDCRKWEQQIDAEMPGLTLELVDSTGRPLDDVQVSIDGRLLDAPAGSEPIPLDPGRHRLVFRAGEERRTAVVALAPGERETLRVVFPALRPSREPRAAASADRAVPPAAWVVGAVGLAALATGATLGLIGHAERSDLRSSCAPNCAPADVDAIERKWTIGAIFAGVGVAASGLAVWIALDADGAPGTGIGIASGARF
jgi:hypothetical protein